MICCHPQKVREVRKIGVLKWRPFWTGSEMDIFFKNVWILTTWVKNVSKCPRQLFFQTKEILFQRKLSTKNRIEKICKWPPARPEVKLPESELLRNEIKLLLCLLVFFTLIFTLNVHTRLTIFIVYNPLLKLSLLLAMIQNIEELTDDVSVA